MSENYYDLTLKQLNAKLALAEQRNAELMKELNPVCCCGASYKDHGPTDNHSFVDAYAYAEQQRIADACRKVVEDCHQIARQNCCWSTARDIEAKYLKPAPDVKL